MWNMIKDWWEELDEKTKARVVECGSVFVVAFIIGCTIG